MYVCVLSSHLFCLFWTLDLWTNQPWWGHTGGRSRRISPPSFCGTCLNFYREKDSTIYFPRRPRSRTLCIHDLIVLHLLGMIFVFFVFFIFLEKKYPSSNVNIYNSNWLTSCGSVCVCFLPIHSGHQWTYQPGSHRRKVTQDF